MGLVIDLPRTNSLCGGGCEAWDVGCVKGTSEQNRRERRVAGLGDRPSLIERNSRDRTCVQFRAFVPAKILESVCAAKHRNSEDAPATDEANLKPQPTKGRSRMEEVAARDTNIEPHCAVAHVLVLLQHQ
jgi:hypothetical protein